MLAEKFTGDTRKATPRPTARRRMSVAVGASDAHAMGLLGVGVDDAFSVRRAPGCPGPPGG